MVINQREEDGILVFALDGRVDTDGSIELERELQAAVGAGRYKIVLDMAGVRYINSAGLRTLADILTTNREHGGDLYLAALTQKVQRVFEIIGFDNFFKIFDDVPTAIKAF